ncbi:hypothetical protein [Lacticaseibacillus kribbianus]|uniref:hypothetical protein n=1 Tax=Lacticaseibacillus kribbianus TaxID=2926292 RepID=UPI001CD7C675|nr:hypothetical protein [Lacticaseibacillus kribbianus]
MTVIKILRWTLRALVVLTIGLLLFDTAVGIGLMAVDILVGVFYEMKQTACDRREMKHVPVTHRL